MYSRCFGVGLTLLAALRLVFFVVACFGDAEEGRGCVAILFCGMFAEALVGSPAIQS